MLDDLFYKENIPAIEGICKSGNVSNHVILDTDELLLLELGDIFGDIDFDQIESLTCEVLYCQLNYSYNCGRLPLDSFCDESHYTVLVFGVRVLEKGSTAILVVCRLIIASWQVFIEGHTHICCCSHYVSIGGRGHASQRQFGGFYLARGLDTVQARLLSQQFAIE